MTKTSKIALILIILLVIATASYFIFDKLKKKNNVPQQSQQNTAPADNNVVPNIDQPSTQPAQGVKLIATPMINQEAALTRIRRLASSRGFNIEP